MSFAHADFEGFVSLVPSSPLTLFLAPLPQGSLSRQGRDLMEVACSVWLRVSASAAGGGFSDGGQGTDLLPWMEPHGYVFLKRPPKMSTSLPFYSSTNIAICCHSGSLALSNAMFFPSFGYAIDERDVSVSLPLASTGTRHRYLHAGIRTYM